jgi:hypothetical protein
MTRLIMASTTQSTQPPIQDSANTLAASHLNADDALESDRESQLATVIETIHELSQSGKYPSDRVLPFLDLAWEAQKLLWKLRQHP